MEKLDDLAKRIGVPGLPKEDPPATHRSKPRFVDAQQYLEGHAVRGVCGCAKDPRPHCHTMHDNQIVALEFGDWIIREPDGQHFYPCKPDVFEDRYESI